MKSRLIIAFLLTCSIRAGCQFETFRGGIATALDLAENESDVEQIIESGESLNQQALNLNSASESELEQSSLFSPFQVFGILKYRDKYGPFFSIYELASIPGFSKEVLESISPYLCLTKEEIRNVGRTKGLILTNASLKLPKSIAYFPQDSISPYYSGSPIKLASRVKYTFGKSMKFGASYEKDPGERGFEHKKPEHVMGYIQYTPKTFVKNLILGNFRIQQGLGLVHGFGFQSRNTGLELNGYKMSFAKPLASTIEYAYYRGIYLETGIKKWRTDIFWSLNPVDISLHNPDKISNLYDRMRESGLHRTVSEISGKDIGRLHSGGISINRAGSNWNIGIAASWMELKMIKAKIDLKDIPAFLESRRSNFSAYSVFFANNFEIYSEYALNNTFKHALLLGAECIVNPAITAKLSLRHYQYAYTGQTPVAFGAGNDPSDNSGMNIALSLVPFPYAHIYLNADISHQLNVFQKEFTPGLTLYTSIRLLYQQTKGPKLEFSMLNNEKNKFTEQEFTGNESIFLETKTRFRLQFGNNFTDQFKSSFRMELSMLNSRSKHATGKLMYQDLTYRSLAGLSITYRFLIFDSPDWDNRLYAYEPGVRYSLAFPVMYGKGARNILLCTYKLTRRFTLRGKLGNTHYSHKYFLGSSHDLRPGDQSLDIEFQIQADL